MVLRFFKWLVHKLGPKPLVGFSLLFIAVGSSAYAFSDAIRQVEFGLLLPMILYALVCSWLLARTKTRGWAAVILLVIVGFVITLVRIGGLINPLFALIRVALASMWEILKLEPGNTFDLANLSLAYNEVYFGVNSVFTALSEWIQSLQDGLPLINDVAISTLWSFVMWLLAAWAGWWMRRSRQPLLALLPIGVFTTAILAYTWSGTIILGPMLSALLLLFAYGNYDRSEEGWKLAKMDYPEDLSQEFSLTSLVVVIGIVMVALIIPSISIRGIVDIVSAFTKPQIQQAEPLIGSFGLQQSSIPNTDIGSALRGGLPRMHLIGSGPELSEEIVMTVKITGGVPNRGENALSLPLYWRSLVYNEYFGFGWRSSDIVLRTYDPGEEVIRTDSGYHQVIQQDFRMAQGESKFLYAAGDIVTADDVFRIAYRPTTRYTELVDAHGDFFGASIDNSAFRVQSLIPLVSESALREAPVAYPYWIIQHYLPLPDSIPSRVFTLAEELTATDLTNYDKVRTLETYLRDFEYTLDVDLPPRQTDLVDYFLFDLQKGYCDYYATTMAVMARGLGIPSRIAIGYVRGTYDNVNNRYIVSEAEAHSWVEIYFPGIGWVPFEPTGGREAITRFESEEEALLASEQQRNLDILTPWYGWLGLDWNWSSALKILFFGILLPIFGILFIDRLRLQNMTPDVATNHLYQRLYRRGLGFGIHTRKESTPSEFSEKLVDQLNTLSQGSLFDGLLLRAISQIQSFTRNYTLMRYSPLEFSYEDRNGIIRLWNGLRFRLLVARLQQFIYRIREFRKGKKLPQRERRSRTKS